MASDTRRARDELAKALKIYESTGDYYYVINASRKLLAVLDEQPSRRDKPWRVTFQHTQGPLAGEVYRNSHRDIHGAVSWMRAAMPRDCRIELSKREADGSYTPLTTQHLADWGYPEFAKYERYGGAHYSQEG